MADGRKQKGFIQGLRYNCARAEGKNERIVNIMITERIDSDVDFLLQQPTIPVEEKKVLLKIQKLLVELESTYKKH